MAGPIAINPGAARSEGIAGFVTPWEVATMMRRAGFPTKELVTGVSVAIAESSLMVANENTSGPVHHYGLFQIAGDKGFDNAKLKSDPQYNVNAAYQVWKSQGWARGWLKYEGGASYKHTAEAAAGVQKSRQVVPDSKLSKWTVHSNDTSAAHEVIGGVPGGDSAYTGVQSAVGGVGDFVSVLGRLDTWVRAGQVVGGGIMMLAGLILFARVNT